MIYFTVLAVLYAVLMVFPFVIGYASLQKKPEDRSLVVKSDNLRDPRYFAKSFVALMDKALEGKQAGIVRLSKEERVTEGDELKDEKNFDSLVVSEYKLFTKDGCVFQKEVLARKYAGIGMRNRLRAIAAQDGLTLKEGCVVERWVDAEGTLRVEKDCELGISATSAKRIVADEGCAFRRLYAPEIITGQDKDIRCRLKCQIYYQEKIYPDILWDQDVIQEEDKVEHSLISRCNLKIGKNAAVYGSVKSEKNIRVCKGATITGNLVAGGDIAVEEGAVIRGIVFSEASIYLGKGAVVGECGMIKSVVAREKVQICVGAVIYGYVSGEADGRILDEESFFREIQNVY